VNGASKKPNDILRHQRQLRSWTLQEVADKLYDLCKKDHPERGINADIVGRWERGVARPSAYYQAKLSILFGMSPDQLGLVEHIEPKATSETTTTPPPSQASSIALLTREQVEFLNSLLTLDSSLLTQEAKDEMMDKYRRNLLKQALLGLPGTEFVETASVQPVTKQHHLVSDDLITLFETTLSTCWELYHTGGAIRVIHGLDAWIKQIVNLARDTQGTPLQKRTLTLLTMSYQLQSCVQRDLMHYPQAHAAYQRAFHVAQELDEPEFIASALAREGVTLIQEEKPKQALIYLDGALTTIESHNFPRLRGNVLQALSEANAKVQNTQDCWYNIGEAENLPEQQVEERSLTRFTKASLLAQKGIDALLLGDYQQAIRLIDQSFTTYDPALVRGRARAIAQKAEAYYGLGAIDECVAQAKEALMLGRAAGSNKTIHRIQKLHATLIQSPLGKEQSISELTEMLITK
jgi:tetratricopeptide (TPR) repeat protein